MRHCDRNENRRPRRLAPRAGTRTANVFFPNSSGGEHARDVPCSAIEAAGVVHADCMPQRDLTIPKSTGSEGVVAAKDPRTYAQIRTRIEDRVRGHTKTGEVH